MNLPQHPELLDRLASAYALGSLRGGARRRFEALAREQAPVRAAALIWQSRVASMNELQAPVEPSPAVWTRIDNLVQGEKQSAVQQAVRALGMVRIMIRAMGIVAGMGVLIGMMLSGRR